MGPCRLPLTKGATGEDERKGLCGATANTVAARNFARMVAAGGGLKRKNGIVTRIAEATVQLGIR